MGSVPIMTGPGPLPGQEGSGAFEPSPEVMAAVDAWLVNAGFTEVESRGIGSEWHVWVSRRGDGAHCICWIEREPLEFFSPADLVAELRILGVAERLPFDRRVRVHLVDGHLEQLEDP